MKTRGQVVEAVAAVIGPDVRHVHNGAAERVQNAIIDRRANRIADVLLAFMPTVAEVAVAIDEHYEDYEYLPVYTEAGDLVGSAAADAVMALLPSGEINEYAEKVQP